MSKPHAFGDERRIVKRVLTYLACILAVFALSIVPTFAASFSNSLWIGNDLNPAFPIRNTDRVGNVLRLGPAGVGVGFGIDLANNELYVSRGPGVDVFDLDTLTFIRTVPLAPGTRFYEDLSFDGTHLLATDFFGFRILRLNRLTGAIVDAFSVGYGPRGLTEDGSGGFWASESFPSGLVHHYDSNGTLLFTFKAFDDFAGGIAFDPTDSTLFVGTFGSVHHFTTSGTEIGSFSTGDSRFVDGLEFQGAKGPVTSAPEPPTIILLGSALVGLFGIWRSRRIPSFC